MVLFAPNGDGTFRSLVPDFVGLTEAVLACLDGDVAPHRFGDTYADADDEAFWTLTAVADQARQLECDADLVRIALGSSELTVAELEAVARVCNARRLALPADSQDTLEWQLLTTVCSEATGALLGG